MRSVLIAATAMIALETAAFACSCLATDDPAELARFGTEAAREAVALVEAEALTSWEATRTGERMRVIRTLAGTAPKEFVVERGPSPSSASCDVLYKAGERVTVILYPSPGPDGPLTTYRTSGLCAVHMLQEPVYREALIKALGGPAQQGERG